uniref:Protein MKS1 n=1 Tax=Anthurium amnicola TaxID=1678845 RepID=A0A1D1YV33_9ARAE
MDKASPDQLEGSKKHKTKKKPIKVVYISNPMRVKTTAAEFKGLVQELTGQDSDIADLFKFNEMERPGEVAADVTHRASGSTDCQKHGVGSSAELNLHHHQHQHRQQDPDRSRPPFDVFDELFNPQGFEDLNCFVPSTSSYYESSSHFDDTGRMDKV